MAILTMPLIMAAQPLNGSPIMLSYRHSFHAGNFADVLKHIVLVECIEHLLKKETAFDYIDTHAGAGLFNLTADYATRLAEHENGIGKLRPKEFPELASYFAAIRNYSHSDTINVYPGSPAIAKYFLRRQDRAWLYELHPQDYQLLAKNIGGERRIRISQSDGIKGLGSVLPPTNRRGLVLIDPSYEIKTEYAQVFAAIEQGYKKFATGTYLLWYPVIDRQRIDLLEKRFKNSSIRNIQRFEMGLQQDTSGHGMTSSGVFVVNPPWTLIDKMRSLLPKLAMALSDAEPPHYLCAVVAAE